MSDDEGDKKENDFKEPKDNKSKEDKLKEKYEGKHGGYGEGESKFNPANGIQDSRGCTDICCLLLFVVFLGTLIAVLGYGIKKGNILKFTAPIDKDNRICGHTGDGYDYTNFKRLFLEDLSVGTSDIFKRGYCVDECPVSSTDVINCATSSYYRCNSNGTYSSSSNPLYKTLNVGGICMPSFADLNVARPTEASNWRDAKEAFLTTNPAGRSLQDLYDSSRAVYASFGMSLIYSLGFIYLMSAFAECISWAIVILIQLGLIGAAMAGFSIYLQKKENGADGANTYLAAGGLFAILSLVYMCMLYCGYQSLKVAIDVIDASADFLAKTKRIIGVPVVYFFITVLFLAFWLAAVISVHSIGEITGDNSVFPQYRSVLVDAAHPDSEKTAKLKTLMFWYMIFGLLWVTAFFRAQSTFITMISASTYYFDSNKDRDGEADVQRGVKYTFFYHSGSLAFGSFVIALIQFIKYVFLYITQTMSEAGGNNQCVACMVKCALCCLECIEKWCDYINKAAFAYMAVTGDNFCQSAVNGFVLHLNHTMQFAWAVILAKTFIFLGKCAVVSLNVYSCFCIMKFVTKDLEEVSSIMGPLFVVGVFTYITVSIFLGMFDEAVMAMMTCLSIDMDINKGEIEYGPPTFHDDKDGKPGNLKRIGEENKKKLDQVKAATANAIN